MKKLVKLVTICMLLVPAIAMGQNSKMEKKLEKAYLKQTKTKIKEYQKEGWKLDGSTKTIEVALMEHYVKLTNANNREIVGSVSGCTSRNVCQNQALNNAMVKYAQEARTFVKGRIDSEVGSLGGTELDNFYGAYERLVAAEISGELELSISLYRENKNGEKEYDAFYIVNEDNASKKRIKAMENALKESEAAQKWGDKISKFVNEGFGISQ